VRVRWAIVTNMPYYPARRVQPGLGWESRCAILVGGDTLAERKPHPLPLLHAAETLGVAVAHCAYVGDDQRDIDAARAAGMRSLVARGGYRHPSRRAPRLRGARPPGAPANACRLLGGRCDGRR